MEKPLARVATRAESLGQLGTRLDPLLVFLRERLVRGHLRLAVFLGLFRCLVTGQSFLVVLEQRLHGVVHQLPCIALRRGVILRPALNGDGVGLDYSVAELGVDLFYPSTELRAVLIFTGLMP